PAAIRRPSGLMATASTLDSSCSTAGCLPAAVSPSRTVWSRLAETRCLLLGLKARPAINPGCPGRDGGLSGESRRLTFTLAASPLSPPAEEHEAVARCFPSGLKATLEPPPAPSDARPPHPSRRSREGPLPGRWHCLCPRTGSSRWPPFF